VRTAARVLHPGSGAEGGAGPDPVQDQDGAGPHLGDPAAGQVAGIGIKLGSVASDITGKSATAMIEALIDGERRGAVLCRLHLDRIAVFNTAVAGLQDQITAKAAPWQRELDLLKTIPGFGDTVAQAWLAEIGPAPHTYFSGHEKLASWVSLCPGNNISARKRKHGRTGDAGTYIKPMLVQAAWSAIKGRGRLQARYNRLVRRFGGDKNPAAKKAITAIAHTLLKIAYQVLKSGTLYQDLGADFYTPAGITRSAPGLPAAPAGKAQPRLHHHHPPPGGRLTGRPSPALTHIPADPGAAAVRTRHPGLPAGQSMPSPDPRPPLRPWSAAARPPGTQFSCQVTLSKFCGAPGTAGGSFAGQQVRQPIRGPGRPRECGLAGGTAEVGINLAGDVTLQAADDFLLGFPFGRAAFGVGTGSRIRAQTGEHDPPQGMVGLAVAARVEPAADGLARGCRDGGGAAQVRPGGLAAQPFRVVSGRDEQQRRDDKP
jgi:hypothetical protein